MVFGQKIQYLKSGQDYISIKQYQLRLFLLIIHPWLHSVRTSCIIFVNPYANQLTDDEIPFNHYLAGYLDDYTHLVYRRALEAY